MSHVKVSSQFRKRLVWIWVQQSSLELYDLAQRSMKQWTVDTNLVGPMSYKSDLRRQPRGRRTVATIRCVSECCTLKCLGVFEGENEDTYTSCRARFRSIEHPFC